MVIFNFIRKRDKPLKRNIFIPKHTYVEQNEFEHNAYFKMGWVFYETNLYIQQESLDLHEKLKNTCIKDLHTCTQR